MGSIAAGAASPEDRAPHSAARRDQPPEAAGEPSAAPPRRDLRWPLYLIGTGLALSIVWSGVFLWGLTRLAGWMFG